MAKKDADGDGLKSIFVISPIGKTDEDGFDFTKLFLEQIVKPAALLAGGYKTPVRGDEVRAPGSITGRVVADILKAEVCVADLTGRNPNVMYEVAIAHAADKQVILLQQEAGGPPFDFTDQRVIHYTTRADKANRARDELVEHLRNANHDAEDEHLSRVMNPVRQIFRDLRTRATASDPEKEILERLDGLGREVSRIRMQQRHELRVVEPSDSSIRESSVQMIARAVEQALEQGDPETAARLERLLKEKPTDEVEASRWRRQADILAHRVAKTRAEAARAETNAAKAEAELLRRERAARRRSQSDS